MVQNLTPKQLESGIINAIKIGILKASFDMEADAVKLAAVDTGRMRASIRRAVKGNTITLTVPVDYAEYLEYGTSKQRAQPFIRPAILRGVSRHIPNRIVNEIKNMGSSQSSTSTQSDKPREVARNAKKIK